ncbi:hypothetical protein ACFL6A_01245, partial [bacterium]
MIEGMQMRRTLFFVLSTFLIVSSMVRSEEPEKKNSGLRNMQTVKFQPSVLGPAQQTKETESSDRLPSKGMAFLYSLLLPG